MKIKDDSRQILPGDTFIALENASQYINDAIKAGATKIINENSLYEVPTLIVNNTRQYLADYLLNTFKKRLKKITLIGITGTNGKTTSAYLTYQLLNMLGVKCAYIGTIGFYLDNNVTPLNNTTPDLITLYNLFEKCIKSKVKVIVMEVSSHSIKLNRILGIRFNYGVLTNITHDHLDFHKDIDDYKNTKKRLFTVLKDQKYAIINSDSNYYEEFMFKNNNNITYGINGTYKLKTFDLFIDHSLFSFENDGKEYQVALNMPGKYNIYNYLTALIICNKYGFSIEKILKKSKNLKAPPGRMDLIKSDNRFIFIDYAHTPDAVLNVLNNVNMYKKGQVITIIGCGGNRDKLKRPIMGKIATENSDYVIFTNDNPRFEDPNEILNDITKDLTAQNYKIIADREEAIKKGIALLNSNDILLILGKGHENYQIINGFKHDFDDKLIALKYLHMK